MTDARSRTVAYLQTPPASSSGTNTPSVTRTVIPTATPSPSPSGLGAGIRSAMDGNSHLYGVPH